MNEFFFAPYYIEPYAVGQPVHAIGRREPPDTWRTLKWERSVRIELLREPYTISEDFDPTELLKHAWGIWYTEVEPVEVILKFSPCAAHRFEETRWHHSERVILQDDGSLFWRAWIAEPLERLP